MHTTEYWDPTAWSLGGTKNEAVSFFLEDIQYIP